MCLYVFIVYIIRRLRKFKNRLEGFGNVNLLFSILEVIWFIEVIRINGLVLVVIIELVIIGFVIIIFYCIFFKKD